MEGIEQQSVPTWRVIRIRIRMRMQLFLHFSLYFSKNYLRLVKISFFFSDVVQDHTNNNITFFLLSNIENLKKKFMQQYNCKLLL